MSKKLGLALGGGGARGVVHIGFLKALEEEGIKPYCISGTSMGAVVGGCYASGMPIDKIRDIVLSLKTMDIVDIDAMPFTRLSLLRSKKLQKLFLKHVGDVQFSDLKIPFTCTAVDLYSQKLYTWRFPPRRARRHAAYRWRYTLPRARAGNKGAGCGCGCRRRRHKEYLLPSR